MIKSLPCHRCLTEPLYAFSSARQRIRQNEGSEAAHASDLLQVATNAYPQHLDCDIPATVFALPHICESAASVGDVRWVVA